MYISENYIEELFSDLKMKMYKKQVEQLNKEIKSFDDALPKAKNEKEKQLMKDGRYGLIVTRDRVLEKIKRANQLKEGRVQRFTSSIKQAMAKKAKAAKDLETARGQQLFHKQVGSSKTMQQLSKEAVAKAKQKKRNMGVIKQLRRGVQPA